ncbi:unnamed protein product [Soboliphyme baturini]|uniref:ZM domain-containing protein n=1 Tax=Soboliphyme baturini TaxID=241478 RepID=A0A183ICQ9_9BILA|nr:unnamed protein product [Soboliphyme baturini]
MTTPADETESPITQLTHTPNMERFWRFTPRPKGHKMIINEVNFRRVTEEVTVQPLPKSLSTTRYLPLAIPAKNLPSSQAGQQWNVQRRPMAAKRPAQQMGLSREQLIQLYNQRMAQRHQQQQSKQTSSWMMPPKSDVWFPAANDTFAGNRIAMQSQQQQQRPMISQPVAVSSGIQQPHFVPRLNPQFTKADTIQPGLKSIPFLQFSHDELPMSITNSQSNPPLAIRPNNTARMASSASQHDLRSPSYVRRADMQIPQAEPQMAPSSQQAAPPARGNTTLATNQKAFGGS